ncbi:MAG: hypothetical protein WA860_13875 [Acidimicrobiales bacterium]|jgi:hypothetical protein
MLISDYLQAVREDLRNLAELTGPEIAPVVERLGANLEPALQKRFLDALNDLVQEFNVQDGSPLSLNFEGDALRLTRLIPVDTEPAPASSDYSARIALRLSDELKGSIENLAVDVGSSVNSWIVRTLERSVRSNPSSSSVLGKRQLRGKGRA